MADNKISKYNGLIYSAVRHFGLFRDMESYGNFIDSMAKRLHDSAEAFDNKACVIELAAVRIIDEHKRKYAAAIERAAQAFNIKLDELKNSEIASLAMEFLNEFHRVPKRFLIAAALGGVLLSAHQSWVIPRERLLDELYQNVSYQAVPHNTTSNLFTPPARPPMRGVTAYCSKAEAYNDTDGIIAALGAANSNLTQTAKEEYALHISRAAFEFGLDPALITGILLTESTGKLGQVSNVGAVGVMQVMWSVHGPSLNKKFGFRSANDLHKPANGIRAGCWILKGYLERSDGNIYKGLGRYYGSQQCRKYYNKVMRWASAVKYSSQNWSVADEQFYKRVKSLKCTQAEAEAIFKTNEVMSELGARKLEDVVLAMNVFLDNTPTERIASLVKGVFKPHHKDKAFNIAACGSQASEIALKSLGTSRNVAIAEFTQSLIEHDNITDDPESAISRANLLFRAYSTLKTIYDSPILRFDVAACMERYLDNTRVKDTGVRMAYTER